ncbi:MAG: transcription elongation factor GreA [Desulfovibrio sp.]|jgi:transcription elongation factor GreA|nr:transcription elongation factor GreA [Desulfovibrio sp.]
MESIPISTQGFDRVQKELARLKSERPHVIKAIQEAREEGDLSENAAYEAARERQSLLEARIVYIESRMPYFNVLDPGKISGERIAFGATVRLADLDMGVEREYIITGPDETDFVAKEKNAVSVFSPVGRALLGKAAGDEVVVDVPRGKIHFEVIGISYRGPFIEADQA